MDDSGSGIIRILSGKSDNVRGLKSFWLDIGQKPFYTPVFDSCYTKKSLYLLILLGFGDFFVSFWNIVFYPMRRKTPCFNYGDN